MSVVTLNDVVCQLIILSDRVMAKLVDSVPLTVPLLLTYLQPRVLQMLIVADSSLVPPVCQNILIVS